MTLTWERQVLVMLAQQERVATHRQLTAQGMALSTVVHRIGPTGQWQRILPGVVLAHRGTPTRRERVLAALAYAGEGSRLTGMAALQQHGVRAAQGSREVHVLVPLGRHRQGHGFAVVERSGSGAAGALVKGVPVASVARAVVDACRRTEDFDLVRELVAEVVQTGKCTVTQLVEAVAATQRARSALTRRALAEVAAGIRSVAEARAREVFARRGVPMPLWNAELLEDDGTPWAVPDGLWEELAAVLLIDSMAWHLRPKHYKRTQARQRDYGERSVLVLPVAPSLVLGDEDEFVRATMAFLREAHKRSVRPSLIVRRRQAA